MIKKFISVILCLLITSVFSFSVYADNVKELNILNQTLEIEREENLLKDSISYGDGNYGMPSAPKIVFVGKQIYAYRVIIPFILISAAGLAVFGIVEIKGKAQVEKR